MKCNIFIFKLKINVYSLYIDNYHISKSVMWNSSEIGNKNIMAKIFWYKMIFILFMIHIKVSMSDK